MAKIVLNVTKTRFFGILAAILIVSGVFAVYAYNVNWKTSPGNPAVMGHTLDEIDGLRDFVADVIAENQPPISTFNCVQVFDSTIWQAPYNTPRYTAVNMNVLSSVCIGNDPNIQCVIKQEIYTQSNLTAPKIIRQYKYHQDSTTQIWTSDYRTEPNKYKNGDTTFTRIIPGYAPYGTGYEYALDILDDYKSTTYTVDDRGPTQWVIKDSSQTYAQKVSICGVSTPISDPGV